MALTASAPPPARGEGWSRRRRRHRSLALRDHEELRPSRGPRHLQGGGANAAAAGKGAWRRARAVTHLPPAVRRPRSPSTLAAWAAPVTSRAKRRHIEGETPPPLTLATNLRDQLCEDRRSGAGAATAAASPPPRLPSALLPPALYLQILCATKWRPRRK